MSTWDVQVAVMSVLNADAELPPVYDAGEIPDEATKPYGTYPSPTSTARGKFATDRPTRETVRIDWWGNEEEVDAATSRMLVHGNKQIAGFAARTRQVLTLGALNAVIPSGRITLCRWEQDVYVPDEDNSVRHLQQLFRVDYEG